MSDKVQLIKEEIESYRESMKGLEPHSDFRRGQITAYNQIMQFIDSLPEEHNEDLEEEINRVDDWYPVELKYIQAIARHFAEWQKNQMKETLQTEYEKGRFDMREEMMKNTVLETEVLMDCDGDGIETPYEEWLTLEDTEIRCVPDGFREGDIVKVVLIKEDLP